MTQKLNPRVPSGPLPTVSQNLRLICKACGQSHTYDVGTIHAWPAEGETDPADRGYGFSKYFRCQNCGGAGPWEVADRFKLLGLTLRARVRGGDEHVVFETPVLFDGTIAQSPAMAEEHLLRLIEREPGNAFLCTRLGNLFRGCGRRVQAINWYGKAIELDKGDIEARYHLFRYALDDNALPAAGEFARSLVRYLLKGRKAGAEMLTRGIAVSLVETLRQALPEARSEFVRVIPGVAPRPEVAFIRTLLEAEGDEEEAISEGADRLLAGGSAPTPALDSPDLIVLEGDESDDGASLDLFPSLRELVEKERLDVRKLTVAAAADEGRICATDRHRVSLFDGKNVAVWEVPSLRDLFRGDKTPPADMHHYPPEYTRCFFDIEKHVLTVFEVEGDRTDQEMETIFSALRRRPDGKNHLGPVHDFLWQVAALTLGKHRLSQAEFESIVGQLERSVRNWAKRPVSRNYARYLREQIV